jgi:hypothetical protein
MGMEQIIADIDRVSQIEPKGIPDRIIKFNEEFGEFCAEIVKLRGESVKPYSRENLIKEGADAYQVLISIFLTICRETDIEFVEFMSAVIEKNKKWEAGIPKYTKYEYNKSD